MKKLLVIIAVLTLSLTLAGCTKEVEVEVEKIVYQDVIVEVEKELEEIPTEVTMADLDMYLGRPDVQYVDLRNFDDKMASGYIAGFEFIPFFDYLEYEGILVRDGNWNFTAADLKIAAALEALFSEDKTIFLMCGSGTRAGYVKAALESIGYTNVINVGGIGTYLEGDATNAVPGDDTYTINMDKKGAFTPGTYFGYDPVGGYQTTVVIGPAGGIVNVVFDAVNGNSTKQNDGFGYGMVAYGGATYEWFQHADMLAAYVVANQGWGDIVLDETDITGLNAQTWTGHHFIEINHDVVIDSIAGVTIGAEGFVLSWNDAISQASSTDLAVVAIDGTPEEWAAAHVNGFTYTDGVYHGMDEASGYSAVVTVEGGFIIDVFFDAIVAETEISGDPAEAVVTSYTTKQVLGFDYNMVAYGGATYEWFEQANMLGAAIVDAQMWSVDWTIVDGNFDGTVDAVAGVSIGVEHFQAAFDEALAQAE